MKHFIATRFNLNVDQWDTTKDGSLVRTEKWLEERFELFESYCLPSVIHQTNQTFFWVIFFDVDTPMTFRMRINNIINRYNNFYVRYIDGIKLLKSSFREFILNEIDAKDNFIITSRLDNDDSIHKDFVDTIQRIAIKKHETVIDLRRGYQMDISDDYYDCRNYYNTYNAFISLVESTASYNTVFAKMHIDWIHSNSIVKYDDHPLWIELIHKRNKLNRTHFYISLIPTINLMDFGIDKKLKQRKNLYIFIHNLKLKLKTSTKLKVIRRSLISSMMSF